MNRSKIGNVTDYPPGKMVRVNVNGKMLLVVNLEEKLYVVDGNCTHMAGHLWESKLIGNIVKCPNHGTEYDVRNGKMTKRPAYPFGVAYDLKSYPVTIEGDDAIIDL